MIPASLQENMLCCFDRRLTQNAPTFLLISLCSAVSAKKKIRVSFNHLHCFTVSCAMTCLRRGLFQGPCLDASLFHLMFKTGSKEINFKRRCWSWFAVPLVSSSAPDACQPAKTLESPRKWLRKKKSIKTSLATLYPFFAVNVSQTRAASQSSDHMEQF